MTCPVCGQPMSEVTTRGLRRKVCSRTCGAALGGLAKWEGRRPHDRAEDVADLLDAGESPAQIALRLGIGPRSIAKALQRAGRYDLARLFEASAVTGRVWGPNYRYAKEAP